MSDDFVTPEPVRLSLTGGAYVDVKKRLNAGEREDMHSRMSPFVVPGQGLQMQRGEVRVAKILAYLIGWSLTDAAGKPVPMSLDLPEAARLSTIRSLDPDRFVEIHQAIEQHEDAVALARAAQKKILSGSPGNGQTSSSPFDAAGIPAGSASSTPTTARSSSN